MHIRSEPAILYFGTPVVLISSVNEDGSYNLAPMSSAFWLGWRSILGLAGMSKTPQNMRRTVNASSICRPLTT
jgi:flavin reductase (DIM6/NTAB) family NADH-FMN oxidoreductase RutF